MPSKVFPYLTAATATPAGAYRTATVSQLSNGLTMSFTALPQPLSPCGKMSKRVTWRSSVTEPSQSSRLILAGPSVDTSHTSHSKPLQVPRHTKRHPAFGLLDKRLFCLGSHFLRNSDSSFKTQFRLLWKASYTPLLIKVLGDLSYHLDCMTMISIRIHPY